MYERNGDFLARGILGIGWDNKPHSVRAGSESDLPAHYRMRRAAVGLNSGLFYDSDPKYAIIKQQTYAKTISTYEGVQIVACATDPLVFCAAIRDSNPAPRRKALRLR